MRKFLALLLTVVCVVGLLSACGDAKNNTSEPTAAPTATNTPAPTNTPTPSPTPTRTRTPSSSVTSIPSR